jgi:hypothetical protein
MWPDLGVNLPGGNPPAITEVDSSDSPISSPGGTVAPATTPPSIAAVAANYKVGYAEDFDLDVQQELPGRVLMDVAYAGNVDRHIAEAIDLNEPQPGAYVTAGIAAPGGITSSNSIELNRIRPYLGYGAFSAEMPIFSSNYNALQIQFREHFHSGSEIGGAYTFSKALGINGGVQDVYDLAADYGVSQRDNMFSGQGVYELPFYRAQSGLLGHLLGGYEFSGVVHLSAGGLGTATTSNQDPAGLGLLSSGSASNARPDRVADPNHGPRQISQWFNTSAFAFVPSSELRPGDESVGTIDGPGSATIDFALMRNVRLAENMSLQLRAEAYNALNHTNLNGPNENMNSTAFGKISGNGDPRNMQIAAKFTF